MSFNPKNYAVAVSIFLLIPCSIFGAGPGTSGSTFLKIGVGARPAALGDAYLALSDDASGFHWNPAGLAQTLLPEISLMHNEYFADIKYEYVGYSMPFY